MSKLCPMCKKHPSIIMSDEAETLCKDKPVKYKRQYYYCSYLGEDDPDAYFETGKLLNENLARIRKAYEETYNKHD